MIICYTLPEVWRVTDVMVIFHCGLFFAPQPEKWKYKNKMKKKKNTTRDIIILHKHTKNHDQRLYCTWDMVHDRYNCYFSFWATFCPFISLTAQKIKISKNEKYACRYHHFTKVTKIMIMCSTVLEIQHMVDVIVVFHFGKFFALSLP